jgi:hypothetical protein
MKTIETEAGDFLYDVLADAVDEAPAHFEFNGWRFETRVGESLRSARERFHQEHGVRVRTHKEAQEDARKNVEEIERNGKEAIAAAGAMTEAEMRDAEVPSLKTPEELLAYIAGLVERPHDYGTCVHAMSMAAVAAYNFVAHKLGVTGFQASCADMDILRRTRGLTMGRVLDYGHLLYPQYCDDEHFPSAKSLLRDPKIAAELKVRAEKKLAESPEAAGPVVEHWRKLAAHQA